MSRVRVDEVKVRAAVQAARVRREAEREAAQRTSRVQGMAAVFAARRG